MNNYAGNGAGNDLELFETPFADVSLAGGSNLSREASLPLYENEGYGVESPFARTYESVENSQAMSESAEDYVSLVGELHDDSFAEILAELSSEIEQTWIEKISNEAAMGSKFIPFATQQAADYIVPLARDTEAMIERVAQHFSGNDLAGHSDTEIEQFFSSMQFSHEHFSPVQDQFFGKIFNKVKSVVKKGVDLAKKGISAVGKLLPINIILNKIKGMVRPLLDKVLKAAIGKLPKGLQPYAQQLAKKFLNLETAEGEAPPVGDFEVIQSELDNSIAEVFFSADETASDQLVMSYEASADQLERSDSYESAGMNVPPLEAARQQFINELKSLSPGDSPAPAIERFLPAALMAVQPVVKMAIGIIGRQRVINFLAGLLAKLVGRYVPENVARPLAASIIDVGMGMIGFETAEAGRSDLGYEAIANTIQDTVQHLGVLNEADLGDTELMTAEVMEAFEKAAAANFPPQYIKPGLRPTQKNGMWVLLPRNGPRPMYKKFTQVFDVTIDPRIAMAVKVYRDLPLTNFLRDKLGLDPSKPISAKVHLYETIAGTMISSIARQENIPGLGAGQPYAWMQLLPLTGEAATLLLKEPSLGVDQPKTATAKRHRPKPGQRYYFLEISGARLRIPQVNHIDHEHSGEKRPAGIRPAQSADIQGVINFVKSSISFNYYFSEEDARGVVEKLNKNDYIGVAISLRQSVKTVMHEMLQKNISSKVKIIHESFPEMYLENMPDQEEFSFSGLWNRAKGVLLGGGKKLINALIEKLISEVAEKAFRSLVEFFKTRAAEFKQAQAQPQDGVTIKIIWSNVPGMSAIRAVISAVRGNFSIGQLGNLSIPSLSAPQIKIVADKKFD